MNHQPRTQVNKSLRLTSCKMQNGLHTVQPRNINSLCSPIAYVYVVGYNNLFVCSCNVFVSHQEHLYNISLKVAFGGHSLDL